MIPEDFRKALAAWFAGNGRRLPWRGGASPYAVLVSEFMLQQTTVAAVRPFFERWLKRFPGVRDLAAADEADVFSLWQGLGYYSRARNLHRAAKVIVERHDGRIPATVDSLRELPGVGPYTAAAIAAFAFDKAVPVIDANIQRVLARLGNITVPVDSAAGRRAVEGLAKMLLPDSGGAAYTAALMDLGATICRAGVPACAACPVRAFCLAQNPSELPVKRPRPQITVVEDRRAFAFARGKVFLVPSDGTRWRGLWTLPPAGPGGVPIAEITYPITRYRVKMEVVRESPRAGWTGFAVDELPAMPSPHRKVLARLVR